jgi:hypothetical protein
MVWLAATNPHKPGVWRVLLEWRDGFRRRAMGASERQQMTLEDALVYWGRLRIFDPNEAGVAFIVPNADRSPRPGDDRASSDHPKRAIFFYIPPELLAMTGMPPVEQVPLGWTTADTPDAPVRKDTSTGDDL